MRRVVPAALLAAALLLSGCTDVGSTGDKGYISGDGTLTAIDPADRQKPVELAGDDLDGEPVDLADLRGEVVVINIWGSWCVDCRVEQPDLNEIAAELGDEAQWLGVNIRESSLAQAQAYVRNMEVPYGSLYSPDSEALLAFAGYVTPKTVPATLVLDREGRIAVTILGRVTAPSTLKGLIEDVAAEDG